MDSALKQRLLGAAVLIALAIIFVPMFFSSSPPKQDSTTLSLSIPPAPERNFETRNLSVDTATKNSPTPKPATPAPADPNKVTTVTTGAPSSFEAPDQAPSSASSKPATASAPSTSKPAAPPTPVPPPAPAADNEGRFVVSLGIYADAGGAAALVAKVKKLGYPAFTEPTEYQGKAALRVRVGPYADRAAAEGVRLKIKQAEDKVPSSVVDLGDRAKETAKAEPAKNEATTKNESEKSGATKAGAAKSESAKTDTKAEAAKADANKAESAKGEKGDAPAPTVPANHAGGYAVQVGAFKSEEEANKLRDRLRNGGVAAFIEKGGSPEQTMWKVRAGPYADRVGADTALANIKQKFQVTGMITTQP